MATLGAIAGIFYKGGNPFKNWQQSPSAPLEQKLFGGPPQLMDAQRYELPRLDANDFLHV